MTEGKTFHFRIRTIDGGILNVSQWAHDAWQAQCFVQRRYPGCTVMQVVDE